MTKQEFAKLAAALKTYFPWDNVLPTPEAMDLWYLQLNDIPYDLATKSLNKWVATSGKCPSIADIRNLAASFGNEQADYNTEWLKVRKAICRGIYHAEEDFEKLSPISQKVVGSPSQLVAWAQGDVNALDTSVAKLFREGYQTEAKRQWNDKLSDNVLEITQNLFTERLEQK